jgi:cell wall-associated NlpC family hydrolase
MNTRTPHSFRTRVCVLATRFVLTSTVAFTAIGASSIAVPATAHASPMTSQAERTISRTTIVARGKTWVDRRVPYNQQRTHEGYRMDCSGFISMAWNLRTPGVMTTTLVGDRTLTKQIAKADLRPGDILVRYDSMYKHAVLFVKWDTQDGGRHRFARIYHEANSDRGTIQESNQDLANNYYSPFRAYRYLKAQ